MNNREAWENYKEYTRDVTEFSRKLAFAGIAIVWVLMPEEGLFSNMSLLALVFIILYFLGDVTQYLTGALRWYRWINSEEEKNIELSGSIEGNYSPPLSLDVPVFYLFWIKMVFLVLGFALLGAEIWQRFT